MTAWWCAVGDVRVRVRVTSPILVAQLDELFPNGRALRQGWGRRLVAEAQRRWGPFVHDGGRSRKGFGFEEGPGLGLVLTNDARNDQGQLYAHFVHLAQTPKSDTLLPKVAQALATTVGEPFLQALGRDHVRRKVPTRTRTFNV